MELPLLLLVALVALGGVLYAAWWQRHRREESLQRLVQRDPSLVRTTAPCGLDARSLAHGFLGTPRGDRRYGLRWGVSGPLPMRLADDETPQECAAFEWWWEERRTQTDQNGTRTTYATQRTVVALVRLPVAVPHAISLTPESVLGRVGLTRRDHQLESSEFNRRFRVRGDDRLLTVKLLDANLQELLTTAFDRRTIELRGELLLLAGRPTHRDGSLHGVIGELPAVRQDAQRLLAAVPAQFWRAIDG